MAHKSDNTKEDTIAYETFVELWKKYHPSSFANGCNVWNTYKKIKHLKVEQVVESLEAGANGDFGQPVGKVPSVKDRDWVNGALKVSQNAQNKIDIPSMVLPIDDAASLYLIVFSRFEKMLGSEKQWMDLHIDTKNRESQPKLTGNDLVASYENILQNEVSVQDLVPGIQKALQGYGKAIEVNCLADGLAISRIVLVSFVDMLSARLDCKKEDELIIVPLAKNRLLATKSSDFMGCNILGDFADALDAHRHDADYITSTPFRIRSCQRQQTELELLRSGILPVTWEWYPLRGKAPYSGLKFPDGIIRHSVPGSEVDAQKFLQEVMRKALRARAIHQPIIDMSNAPGISGTPHACPACHKVVVSSTCVPCVKCKRVAYCSASCRQDHSKLHKLQCKYELQPQVCDGCSSHGWSFMKCSLCTLVRYCSKKCQKAHWKTHKKDCLSATVHPEDSISNADESTQCHVDVDFTVGLAETIAARDDLLRTLFQKYLGQENLWTYIECDFNKMSSEKKSKPWLRNRAKKIGLRGGCEDLDDAAANSDMSSVSKVSTLSLVSVATQQSRCFLADALFKSSGKCFVRAGDLQINSEVEAANGNLIHVTAAMRHEGEQDLVELRTHSSTLTVTHSHRIMVERRSGPQTLPAGDLKIGDEVLVSDGRPEVLQGVTRTRARVDVVELFFHPDEPVEAFHPLRPAVLSKGQGGAGTRRGTRGTKSKGKLAEIESIPETLDSLR